MKIWKKINKGLLLTIIVLIVLIIYLKGVEKQREADKTAIKTSCEEYINLIDNLMVSLKLVKVEYFGGINLD